MEKYQIYVESPKYATGFTTSSHSIENLRKRIYPMYGYDAEYTIYRISPTSGKLILVGTLIMDGDLPLWKPAHSKIEYLIEKRTGKLKGRY